MKFELKTENENHSKFFANIFWFVSFLTIVIIFFDVLLKLGIISRNHKIEYNCRLLSVEKSKPHFKNLSRLSNLKSKQQIWKFCSEANK